MISIRATEPDDLEWVIAAESNPENSHYVDQWTLLKHLNVLNNNDIRHLIVIDEDANKVGYIILAGIENDNNSIEFRRLVITEKSKGYGKLAIEKLVRLSFDKFKCHRLWLDVRIYNKKAINMYEGFGFKKEGLLRECAYLNGKYESSFLYSILNSEYVSKFK